MPRRTRSAPTASSSPASPPGSFRWRSATSCSETGSPMVVITAPSADVPSGELAGKSRDALRLTWEERRWTRKRVRTEAGRELALALPTGSRLRPGAVIAVGEDWYAAVEACEEPVIAIAPRDGAEAV